MTADARGPLPSDSEYREFLADQRTAVKSSLQQINEDVARFVRSVARTDASVSAIDAWHCEQVQLADLHALDITHTLQAVKMAAERRARVRAVASSAAAPEAAAAQKHA